MRPIPTALAALTVILAGCAATPEIVQSGTLKPGGFAFSPDAPPEAVKALVSGSLTKAGLTPAPDAAADYIVHVGLARAPSKVGLYRPSPDAPNAPPADWLAKPAGQGLMPGRGQRQRISVMLVDAKTGKAAFYGAAGLRGGKDETRLAELVAAAISPQP